MLNTIMTTDFKFEGQKSHYRGKVREVYNIDDKYLVMIASDRISAFDVVLPAGIPFKGQVLNQVAEKFMKATADIVPNWIIDTPDPSVAIGHLCDPFKVEMVIRGYLSGHAWREYRDGKRIICGVSMPDGMKENDKFPEPLLTPTTKEDVGHDEDISREDILAQGLVSEEDYVQLEDYTRKLFQRGTEIAADMGLILVDTKYEFGMVDGELIVIDEIHTPDSSRYWIADEYEARFDKGEGQKMLDKENIRQWLIERGFSGEGTPPALTDEIRVALAESYIELYTKLTGQDFYPKLGDVKSRIENNLEKAGIYA